MKNLSNIGSVRDRGKQSVSSQSDGRPADSAGTNEGDWGRIFRETNDPLDQFAASETGPRCRRRRFTRQAGHQCKRLRSLAI